MKTLCFIACISVIMALPLDVLHMLGSEGRINLPADFQIISDDFISGADGAAYMYVLNVNGKTCKLDIGLTTRHQFLLGSTPYLIVLKDDCGLTTA
ncbi:hypothetical protein ACF0H5_013004 [Mactra antiquata]